MKTELKKLNLNDQDIFEIFALILELHMMQFDLVDKILPKTKNKFKELNKVTEQGVLVIKFLRWCYNKN